MITRLCRCCIHVAGQVRGGVMKVDKSNLLHLCIVAHRPGHNPAKQYVFHTTMSAKRTLEQLIVTPTHDHDGVIWAKSDTGPVRTDTDSCYSCYDCGRELIFVKAHKSRRNGIEHNVTSYFRHTSSHKGECCAETILHRAAKHAACVHGSKLSFVRKCVNCQSDITLKVAPSDSVYKEEVNWTKFRLDVGIFDRQRGPIQENVPCQNEASNVVGAIEILVTHKSSDDKIAAMTEAGLAWIEVYAHTVLDAINDGTFRINVYKCAQSMCDACTEDIKSDAISKMKADIVLSQQADSELQAARADIIRSIASRNTVATTNNEQDSKLQAWEQLTNYVYKTVTEKAKELGIESDEAEVHCEDILSNSQVLQFGKHKGRTVSHVYRSDWPYLLWLAGYNFGNMDENGRPEKRRKGLANTFITHDVEKEAKQLALGACFRCQSEIDNFHDEPWRTWCKSCFRTLRYS